MNYLLGCVGGVCVSWDGMGMTLLRFLLCNVLLCMDYGVVLGCGGPVPDF